MRRVRNPRIVLICLCLQPAVAVAQLGGAAADLAELSHDGVPARDLSRDAPLDIHDIVSRAFVSFTSVDYGWDRQDRFINNSTEWSVRVDGVSGLAVDPQDVGYDDIAGNPGNWPQVAAAATAAYPEWHFFGGCWWVDINPAYTQWAMPTFEVQGADFPVLLGPGESLVLTTHLRGNVGPQAGEVVIGWRFAGVTVAEASLAGSVRDQRSGNPIEGAEVSITGIGQLTTGPQGEFVVEDMRIGETTVDITKSGYYPVSQTITVDPGSTTMVEALLTPDTSFGIVEVRGRYCSPGRNAYYLDGVSFTETFTATVEWGASTPGYVQWDTGSVIYPDLCPGDTVSRSLDVGAEFGAGGTLRATAVSGDEPPIESEPYTVNFKVIPPPPLTALVPAVDYAPRQVGGDLEYQIMGIESVEFSIGDWDAGRVPADFPLFGGKAMGVGPEFKLSGAVDQDGTMELFTLGLDATTKKKIRKGVATRGKKGIKLPFVELGASGAVDINMAYSDDFADWLPTGGFELGADIMYATPQLPLPPPVPPGFYWRAEMSLDLTMNLGIGGWSVTGPEYTGSFQFEPLAKGIGGAGVARVLAVELYAGAGFHAGLTFLPEVEWQNPYIILVGGVNLIVGGLTQTYQLDYTWPEQMLLRAPSWNEMLRGDNWTLLPRDYLLYRDTEAIGDFRLRALRDGTEGPIQTAVFPYSTPRVATVGESVLAVWVADDTDRDLINRTALTFARHDGGWTASAQIADDGTADWSPQLVSLPDGGAACIWQNANAILDDDDSVETFLSHLEVAVSIYDVDSNAWSQPVNLTSNSVLDRPPNLAVSSNGMLATWVSNAANDLWGSGGAPNVLLYSISDGSTWSPPDVIASGFGTILDTTLAYDGGAGTFVFCTDADDDLDTPEDQELWATVYSAGAWSTPEQITSNGVTDAAPRLDYDANGTLRLVWLQGNDIRMTAGTDVDNSTLVVTPNESMGSKDFDLVVGETGRIALVWNDVSETYNDIWVSYYEPTMDAWSQPRQLTFDDSAERFISGAFNIDDDLFAVYDKTETLYEDRWEWVNGELVAVEGVPEAGQSDLYYLTHHLDGDLAVAIEDVNVDPPNPLSGTVATITARIRNIGEFPASDIEVEFYEGDPDAGGTLIDIGASGSVLVGGDEVEVSVEWPVPATSNGIEIFVRADPNLAQEDRDRSNNTVSFWVLAPDVVISEVRVQAAGPHRIIVVRVANEGALTVKNVDLVLRRDAADGDILTTNEITQAIVPGAYRDVSWVWEDIAPIPGGLIKVFALVDEDDTIDEFDEHNNVRSALVTNMPSAHPGDWDGDGDVDLDDFAEFPGCLSGPWQGDVFVMPVQDCLEIFDFDADADVDLGDFASFEGAFTGPG